MTVNLRNEFNPYPKSKQLGLKTKKKRKSPKNKNFTQAIKLAIFKRDEHRCVKCGSHKIENVPHHVIYKSQGGLGTKQNGATVCRLCHDWAHHKRKGPNGEPSSEGRQWFVDWCNRCLDENGDRKEGAREEVYT
ncbi:HNH endonuclease [Paraliobacillus salinarum]|uniref:HNH endonuclease n=1 Tax=Paraliobacillus salinarum TaxID=1158996 RepID=UPI0015F3E594|nr:HNH endonuclease [Paraliobacillus salinarum]